MRRRLVLVLASVGLILLGSSAPAALAVCEGDPPAPQPPDSGVAGWFVDPVVIDVDPDKPPPPVPDPFGDEEVSFVDTYGYAYNWGTYDLGCGPNATRDPMAIALTGISNFIFDMGSIAGAASQSIQGWVYGGPLGFLDDTISGTQVALFDSIWSIWFPVSVMVVGLFVLVRAKRAEFSETTRTGLLVMVVLAASLYLLTWPVKVMNLADQGVTEGVAMVTSPLGEERIEEHMARSVYYPTWLRGQLGSDTSAVAQEYGPELFRSLHYSWTEVAVLAEAEPFARDAIINEKKAVYENIAAEIKEEHPGAYEHLTGRVSENRLGTATVMVFFATASALFVVVGMALILLAMMVIRAFILAFPLIGIAGAHPQGRPALRRLWDLLTAACWNVLKFAIATAVFLVVAGALLASDANALFKIVFLVVLTVAMFLVAKPFRSAKTMIPGMDPDKSYLRSGLGSLFRYRVHRSATRDGVDDAQRDAEETTPGQERSHHGTRAEDESLPPLHTDTAPPKNPGDDTDAPTYEWSDTRDGEPVGASASAAGMPGAPGAAGSRRQGPTNGRYPERMPAGAVSNGHPGQRALPPADVDSSYPTDLDGPRGSGATIGAQTNGTGRASEPGMPDDRWPDDGDGRASAQGIGWPSNGDGARVPLQGGNGRHARPGESLTASPASANGAGRAARNGAAAMNGAATHGAATHGSAASSGTKSPQPAPSMPPADHYAYGATSAKERNVEIVDPVYRRGFSAPVESAAADLPVAEPMVDEDGHEVFVIYQRGS